jgi:hypothetical protein
MVANVAIAFVAAGAFVVFGVLLILLRRLAVGAYARISRALFGDLPSRKGNVPATYVLTGVLTICVGIAIAVSTWINIGRILS